MVEDVDEVSSRLQLQSCPSFSFLLFNCPKTERNANRPPIWRNSQRQKQKRQRLSIYRSGFYLRGNYPLLPGLANIPADADLKPSLILRSSCLLPLSTVDSWCSRERTKGDPLSRFNDWPFQQQYKREWRGWQRASNPTRYLLTDTSAQLEIHLHM